MRWNKLFNYLGSMGVKLAYILYHYLYTEYHKKKYNIFLNNSIALFREVNFTASYSNNMFVSPFLCEAERFWLNCFSASIHCIILSFATSMTQFYAPLQLWTFCPQTLILSFWKATSLNPMYCF